MAIEASSISGTAPVSERLDYRALYYLFRERAWAIALCLLIAGLATATFLERSPSIYASTTVLLVEQEDAKVVDIQRVQQDEFQSLESLKTVEQTLQNRALIERVIDANDLSHDSRLISTPTASAPTREQLISKVEGMVEVKLRRGTRLIDITVESTDAALTALIANSLVTEFLRQDYEQDATSLHTANEFLEGEAVEIKHKLDDSENALQAYREQTHSVSSADAQNIVVQELNELSVKATEAKSQRITCETAYKEVEALGDNIPALLATPAADNSVAIKDILANITRAESDLADLKPRYKPKHPKYMEAESQLAEWRNALNRAVLELPQTALSAYESSKAAELALNEALQEQQAAALEMNRNAIRYDVLARDVESNRALYQTVLNQVKDNSVIKDLKTSNIRIVEKGEIPSRPVRPDELKVILAGSLCGLLGSVLVVFFLNAIDQSLKTVNQTEECLGLSVLCAIPKFNALAQDENFSKAEIFRTLRACLSTLSRKDDNEVFLFTSSLPGEGKTFCALNYALSLAQQGLTTLLIDCDLRRPTIEGLMRKNNERRVGLTDYLMAHKTLAEVVHPSGTANLFYIPGGSHTDTPAELLANGEFNHLIQEGLPHFDRVIVDSAPIHVVGDTLLILDSIQSVCLVVHANRTPKASVQRTVELLRQAEAPLAGVILNLMPRSANNAYYYDYAYRGNYAESASGGR
jgi:succinoglycan biosynthesis transport protein ExoP